MPKTAFLTAEWRHLVNVTFKVPPELLRPHLPEGLTLDIQQGFAFASLVGFDFLETKVFGVRWPGYRNFPELNLRFYIKHGDQRGVVFIREYVPKRLIAAIARMAYNEPYRAAPMHSSFKLDQESAQYRLTVHVGGKDHCLWMKGKSRTFTAAEDSTVHYFKEHAWGYGRDKKGRTLCYEVAHPIWQTYPVQSWGLDLDFAALYGPQWAFLNEAEPHALVFAEGSPVAVNKPFPLNERGANVT